MVVSLVRTVAILIVRVDVMAAVHHVQLVDVVQDVLVARVHVPEAVQDVRALALTDVKDALVVVQVVHQSVLEDFVQHARVHARVHAQRHVPTTVLEDVVQRVPLNVVAHHPLQ